MCAGGGLRPAGEEEVEAEAPAAGVSGLGGWSWLLPANESQLLNPAIIQHQRILIPKVIDMPTTSLPNYCNILLLSVLLRLLIPHVPVWWGHSLMVCRVMSAHAVFSEIMLVAWNGSIVGIFTL